MMYYFSLYNTFTVWFVRFRHNTFTFNLLWYCKSVLWFACCVCFSAHAIQISKVHANNEQINDCKGIKQLQTEHPPSLCFHAIKKGGSMLLHENLKYPWTLTVLAERELLVLQALEDLDIQEDQNAVFVCELSVEDVPGEWYRNGERIQPTSTVKIRQEGQLWSCSRHLLVWRQCQEDLICVSWWDIKIIMHSFQGPNIFFLCAMCDQRTRERSNLLPNMLTQQLTLMLKVWYGVYYHVSNAMP